MDFGSLPLHDAPVYAITYIWDKRILRIEIAAFINRNERAVPYVLEFFGVSGFEVPHQEPWGPSCFINDAKYGNGEYEIEMQSGDTLLIRSEGYEFNPASL